MATPAPQQPTPHPEAPPPPGPEARAAQPQVKPPDLVEVTRLQADFITAQTGLDKARSTLKTAQAVKARQAIKLDSPEYQRIVKRQQAGESIDEIISKSAANLRGLYETTLDRELPFQEAQASLLRSKIGLPATEQDILRIVNGLEKHHALRLKDPALAEVTRRKQAGETLAEIRAKAQQVIDRRERASKTLRIAKAMKHPQNARPLYLDIEATIKNRMNAGESLDDIINKTRANLDSYAEIDRKKGQLAQAERRIEEIKMEKEVLAGIKQREQELASQQELSTVRKKLESLAGRRYQDVSAFLRGEFGIEETQLQLLPEFSNAPKGETVEARQLRIAQNILEQLKRKGALATSKENRDFFKKNCGLPDIAAPEVYMDYPAGATFFDPQSGDVKVYFNPGLHFFKADYQLYGVLEEAIHYSQLKQTGRNVVTEVDEVDAKDRILRLANSVGFDRNRIEYGNKMREAASMRIKT